MAGIDGYSSPFNVRNHQRGFVLVSCLWVLAIMFVLVSAFDVFVERKIEQARLLREHIHTRFDGYSTRQNLLYLFATQRYTLAGLTTNYNANLANFDEDGNLLIDAVGGELRMDSSPYSGQGEICFSLQDAFGLIGLNTPGHSDLQLLLTAEEENLAVTSALLDALKDYRDDNSLKSLNGAEAREYMERGLPPPTNYHLRAPVELFRVLGWQVWLDAHPRFEWWQWLSINRSMVINPNTVPVSLLTRLQGMTNTNVQRISALRAAAPFKSATEFHETLSFDPGWPEEKYRFLPDRHVQIRLWRAGGRQLQVIELEFTPLGVLGPWQQKYNYTVTLNSEINVACAPNQTSIFQS